MNNLNGWYRIEDKPKEKGIYITADVGCYPVESFEKGLLIPSIDDIQANYWDGENFCALDFECEYYAVCYIRHWIELPLPKRRDK